MKDFIEAQGAGANIVFADHDVVVLNSLDDVFSDAKYQQHPIISMCDFTKKYRPENKMANTGFMLVSRYTLEF